MSLPNSQAGGSRSSESIRKKWLHIRSRESTRPARSQLCRDDDFKPRIVSILTRLEEFLRSHDRNDEADAYAERRAEVAPAPALGDAFARRIERIA